MSRITENKISFNFVNHGGFIELNSDFEDHSYYEESTINALIKKYEDMHKKQVIFYTMNEKLCNGENIVYKNYAWNLYKDINAPEPQKHKYQYTYLCGFPREDKLHMLSALFKEDMLRESLWSCGSLKSPCNLQLPNLPKILDYDKSIKGKRKCWNSINVDFHQYSRFSLVQETEMSSRSNRYTEKTYKCFWMKHPFVLAGNYRTLDLLKKDGFKTFQPYIDESYDNIEVRDERIKKIIEQVKCLCSKSSQEWKEFMSNVRSILEHNYNHALLKSN